jgi:hypothetical protein
MMEALEAFFVADSILPQRRPGVGGVPYERITPHPVLLPMGEGTPELSSERATPSPLRLHPLADADTLRCKLAKASLRGEGQGEGSDASSPRQPLMPRLPDMTVENAANFITYSSMRMALPKRRGRDNRGMFRKSKAL